MKKNFIEELTWRGMLQDTTPFTKENFDSEGCAGYIGFDPTASSLHIGNLAAIMLLRNLQLCGHKPIILLGGFTGMIGDPAGKSAERIFLNEDVLQENLKSLREQFGKFLDFDCGGISAEIVNNYDWLSRLSLPTFFREIGKYVSLNKMLNKESVKKRLDSESGVSYTEFSYQIFQAYDFYWLYKNKNCKLQMGGSDQWGNIMSGIDFIHRKLQKQAYAVTCPLLIKSDGIKFGKTEDGNVWLDRNLTNPYKFYQFWLNIEDSMIGKLFRTFTLFNKKEIEDLEKSYADNPNALKKKLAEDLTIKVHTKNDYHRAVQASELLFSKSTIADFEKCDQETLSYIFSDIPQMQINRFEFTKKALVDLVADTLSKSKGEIKRLINGGGLNINKRKISTDQKLNDIPLLKNEYLLLQSGKNYNLVKVTN